MLGGGDPWQALLNGGRNSFENLVNGGNGENVIFSVIGKPTDATNFLQNLISFPGDLNGVNPVENFAKIGPEVEKILKKTQTDLANLLGGPENPFVKMFAGRK